MENERHEININELSYINDELIQSIDLEKKAKDEVAKNYETELNILKDKGIVQNILISVEVERLHQMIAD